MGFVTRRYSSGYGDNVQVFVRHGFPVLSLPLPSRREVCEFTIRPYLQNVGSLLNDIKVEDGGIDRVAVYSRDGQRVSQSTSLDLLLQGNFEIEINDTRHKIEVPEEVYSVPVEGERALSDVKNMIHKLYTSLNVDKHQLSKERELRKQLEEIQSELAPLETQCQELMEKSTKRTTYLSWGLLAYMCAQTGFFARLTFVNYSWDLMEPITYFVTYTTSILCFAYFVITRQDFVYPDWYSREKMKRVYSMAQTKKFDVERFNHLKDTMMKVEGEIERLHDPLQLNLPTPPIKPAASNE